MEPKIDITITTPSETLERSVNLADREALKKLKKRVVAILNDAIDAVPNSKEVAGA